MTERPWPLSGAATLLLRRPDASPDDVLKVALKELVMRRVWRLMWRTKDRRVLGPKRVLAMAPGERSCPALGPLRRVDVALRRHCPEDGDEVRRVVQQMVGSGEKIARRSYDDAADEAERFGVVDVRRRKVVGLFPWTTITRTDAGDEWCDYARTREARLAEQLRNRGTQVLGELAPLAGLVVVLSPPVLAELDEVLRRQGADGGAEVDVSGLDLDVSSALDSAFDSAVDAGSSDGGGDGGGGGGD